jgi:hypothetical protein
MAQNWAIKYYKVKLLKFDTVQIMQQLIYYGIDGGSEWYRFGWEDPLSQQTFDEHYEILEEIKL